jgi:acetylornithine deacetylase
MSLHHESPDVIELAQQLVRIESVTGHEGTLISEFVADHLSSSGLNVRLFRFDEKRFNVLATTSGRKPIGSSLLINGHLDTKPLAVSVESSENGYIERDLLFGRGSCDTKGGIAAVLIAVRKAIAASDFSGRAVTLAFEVGEEGGGWGLFELLKTAPRADAFVSIEPTGLNIGVGTRGQIRFLAGAEGFARHAAVRDTGGNAISAIATLVQELSQVQVNSIGDPERNAWIVPESITGGFAKSAAVPDSCEATFDARFGLEVEPAALMEECRRAVKRAREAHPKCSILLEVSGHVVAPIKFPFSESLHIAVRKAVESALNRPPVEFVFPAWCSATIVAQRGIPAIVLGPGDLSVAHTPKESVSLEELVAATQIYADLILHFNHGNERGSQ